MQYTPITKCSKITNGKKTSDIAESHHGIKKLKEHLPPTVQQSSIRNLLFLQSLSSSRPLSQLYILLNFIAAILFSSSKLHLILYLKKLCDLLDSYFFQQQYIPISSLSKLRSLSERNSENISFLENRFYCCCCCR